MPSAIPLPPAATKIPSPKAESSPSAASIPSAPQPTTSSSGGDRADAALDGRAGRSRSRARTRTGSRRRRRRTARPDSATTGPPTGPTIAPRSNTERLVARSTTISSAGTRIAAIVATGRAVRSSVSAARSASRPRRSAALRRRRVAPVLAHPDLVADPFELRRPLAQPGAAVGALGHIRADLGPAALADDGQLGVAHRARITVRRAPAQGVWCARRSRAISARGRRVRSIVASWRCAPVPLTSRSSTASSSAPQPSAAASSASNSTARAPSRAAGPGRRRGSRSAARRCRGGAARILLSSISSVGYSTSGSLGVVERAEAVGEADGERRERDGVLDPRLLVEDPRLDRAEVRDAGARPTTGRCSRGSRRRASSARPGARRSPRCRSGAGCPRAGRRGRSAPATTSARCARPPRTGELTERARNSGR